MKKVLIIANLYHASPRIPSFAQYLPEFGWEATIISPPFNPKGYHHFTIILASYSGDIFTPYRKLLKRFGYSIEQYGRSGLVSQIKERTNFRFIDKLMLKYQEVFGYPDAEKTWIKPATFKATLTTSLIKPDVIISSSPYPSSHIIASTIKDKFIIKWIADFRDPWTLNHCYPYGNIRRWFDKRLELKTLKNADAIIAASPEYANKQAQLHNKRVHVITNGFIPDTKEYKLTDKFTITYTGQIIQGKQDVEKIIKPVAVLIEENKIDRTKIEVRFFGQKQQYTEDLIKQYKVEDCIKQYGIVSHKESLERQKESHVLLLLNWEDHLEKGVYTTKFFEYLGANRPILAVGGIFNDEIESILNQTQTGIFAVEYRKMKSSILELFYGTYKFNPVKSEVDKYSYRSGARKLAEIMYKVCR